VTVQLSQIQTPPTSLLQDSHTQNTPDQSFQKYLEEETRRLAFFFSPFHQCNFGSWFEYPDFTLQSGASADKVPLFSDIDFGPAQTFSENTPASQTVPQKDAPLPRQTLDQISQYFSASPAQSTLRELLVKSGWLVPNLESHPLFYQAQLEGKLVNKLDLQFLIDQILSQVRMVREKGKVELTLGLKPENLGEILLTLTSKSGMVSIQIQASPETRKLIEEELLELELALKKAKVNLAEIKILSPEEVNQHA
jgi:hypothetical protein